MTAMNDGLGVAIDNTGKWLAAMKEEDRPGKVMIAVFTDGLENSSKEYTLKQVKDMIEHQEKVYNWTFLYLGTDITTTKMADDLGFKMKTYSSRKKMTNNYDIINTVTSCYRSLASTGADAATLSMAFCSTLDEEATKNTADFEKEIGKKITNE
jgi:microsomal dipeptidase-like Zn-dependent dipeptidase